jgi:uncharacterized protein (DUF983 family)
LLFLRALVLRCPHCGKGSIFRHWFAMKEHCPTCGLSLATGNRVGAYILNLFAAESLVLVILVAIIVDRWPNPPWNLLQWLVPICALLAPLAFYPFSKLVFVAIDLAMHPGAEPDRLVHEIGSEPGARGRS